MLVSETIYEAGQSDRAVAQDRWFAVKQVAIVRNSIKNHITPAQRCSNWLKTGYESSVQKIGWKLSAWNVFNLYILGPSWEQGDMPVTAIVANLVFAYIGHR